VKMAIVIKEILLMERWRVREFLPGKMEISTKEIIRMIFRMARGSQHGQMVLT